MRASTASNSSSILASCLSSRAFTARSSSPSLVCKESCDNAIVRSLINSRTTSRLIATARGEFRTLAAITAPCSVRTSGRYRRPPRPGFEVAICDLKPAASIGVSLNAKSSGKRSELRRICSFNRFVGTPKRAAKSEARITWRPLMECIGGRAGLCEGTSFIRTKRSVCSLDHTLTNRFSGRAQSLISQIAISNGALKARAAERQR